MPSSVRAAGRQQPVLMHSVRGGPSAWRAARRMRSALEQRRGLEGLPRRREAGRLREGAEGADAAVLGHVTLQTIFLRYARFEPAERRLPQAAADYTQWFASRLRGACALLGDRYAAADRFTAADISMGYAIKLAEAIGLGDAVPPRAKAYWSDLRQRPGYLRAEAAERPAEGAAA